LDRLFLDANILFSAAYNAKSLLHQLWQLDDVELMTSIYAVEEARRNLSEYHADRLAGLQELVAKMSVVLVHGQESEAADDVGLPQKDVPILQAAISAGATHLLTGDKDHFERLFDTAVAGVCVKRPTAYLDARKRRAKPLEG